MIAQVYLVSWMTWWIERVQQTAGCIDSLLRTNLAVCKTTQGDHSTTRQHQESALCTDRITNMGHRTFVVSLLQVFAEEHWVAVQLLQLLCHHLHGMSPCLSWYL